MTASGPRYVVGGAEQRGVGGRRRPGGGADVFEEAAREGRRVLVGQRVKVWSDNGQILVKCTGRMVKYWSNVLVG